jgi:hypothetical protein
MMITCKFDYFGYSTTFDAHAGTPADILRAVANARVKAEFGIDPAARGLPSYVEPHLPFPAYVPVQIFDPESGLFF